MTSFQLAGPPEFTSVCAVPALAGLVRQGLTLRVSLGRPAEALLEGLEDGRFDAVISTAQPGDGVAATVLFEEEFVLIAAPEVAAGIDRERLATDPGVLDGTPFIAYGEDLPMVRRYWRTVYSTKPAFAPAAVVPDLRGVLSLTLAGSGVTVLPRYICRNELREGQLVTLADPVSKAVNTIFLVALPGGETEELRAVRECLLAAAAHW